MAAIGKAGFQILQQSIGMSWLAASLRETRH
jgi:hypothetical protein